MSSTYAPQQLPPHLDPRGGRRAGGPGAGTAITLGKIVTALISALTLIVAGYLWYEARALNNAGKRLRVQVAAGNQNILLVGNDDRSNMTAAEAHRLHLGQDGGSMATDTMIIVHVPSDGSKATLISLPRDSYVAIPGVGGDGKDKLNSAYSYGFNREIKDHPSSTKDERQTAAINLLIQTIEGLTGLDINHYIQVSLLGFVRLSDAIGGVPINLCHSVDDTHRYNVAHGQDGGSGLVLSKGRHDISGLTALQFVRQRHNIPGGDLGRARRQQYFLTAAFRQAAGVGLITKLRAINGALGTSIVADRGLNLLDLAGQMANLSANHISGHTIPTTNGSLPDGTSILQVDPAQVKSYVNRLVDPPPAGPSPKHTGTSTRSSATKSAKPKAIDAKCID